MKSFIVVTLFLAASSLHAAERMLERGDDARRGGMQTLLVTVEYGGVMGLLSCQGLPTQGGAR